MSGRLVNDSPIYDSLAMEFHSRRVAELLADDEPRPSRRWTRGEVVIACTVAAFLLALVVLLATGGTR